MSLKVNEILSGPCKSWRFLIFFRGFLRGVSGISEMFLREAKWSVPSEGNHDSGFHYLDDRRLIHALVKS